MKLTSIIFAPQVHIVFNSREKGRITEPLLENPPHKLYYFTAYIKDTKQTDANLEFMEQNIQMITQHIPSITITRKIIDYVDYLEIIQEISKIVKMEREENPNTIFYINVSSGSKITAIASLEAAKIWGLEYYYVYSSKYDPYEQGPIHKGKYYIIKPVTFPIQKPRKDHIQTLKLIDFMIQRKYKKIPIPDSEPNDTEKFIYLKELIHQLESSGIVQLDHSNKEDSKRKSALYMKVKDFLNPLEKTLEYIAISKDKRNRKVILTDKGIRLTQIYKYLD